MIMSYGAHLNSCPRPWNLCWPRITSMKRKMTSNECLDIHPFWAHDVAVFIQISWSMNAKLIFLNIIQKSLSLTPIKWKKMNCPHLKSIYYTCNEVIYFAVPWLYKFVYKFNFKFNLPINKQNKNNVKVWFIHRCEWEPVHLYRESSLP